MQKHATESGELLADKIYQDTRGKGSWRCQTAYNESSGHSKDIDSDEHGPKTGTREQLYLRSGDDAHKSRKLEGEVIVWRHN